MKSQLALLVILFSIITTIGRAGAQDSVKHTASAAKKPVMVVKPQAKYQAVKPGYTKKYSSSQPYYKRDTSKKVPVVNTDRSLSGQYRYLLGKLYNYQQPMVGAFYKNIQDTLKTERAALKTAQATVKTQADTIKHLLTGVTIKDEIISSSNEKMNEISLLGIPFTKTSYNLLMWTIVIVLALALVIIIASTGRLRHEAKYRTKLYEELSEEFQSYKSKSNEKEKKLARELQTERNKLDELLGRG